MLEGKRIRISLSAVEIVRAFDRILFGSPEPTFLLGVYAVTDGRAHLLSRTLYRVPTPTDLPCMLPPIPSEPMELSVRHSARLDYVLLMMALEKDRGTDVRRLYGLLEHHEHLAVWSSQSHDVQPLHIEQTPLAATELRRPTRVHVIADGDDSATSCGDDKWVGAVVCVVPSGGPAEGDEFRFPFLSEDRKNDWTAIVHVVTSRS